MIETAQPTAADRDRVHRLAQRYAKSDDVGTAELLREIAVDGRITEALLAACAQIHRPRPEPDETAVLRRRAAFLWEAFLMSRIGGGGGPQVMAELVRSTQLDGHLVAFVYELLRVAADVVPDLGRSVGRFGFEGLRYAQLLADAAVDAADDPTADDHVRGDEAGPWLAGGDDDDA